jgi:hypothetical protein
MDPNEANESVAEKFTNVMNATPSSLSALCDLGIASVVSGLFLVIGLFVIRHSSEPSRLYAVLAVAASPFLGSYGLQIGLRRSRQMVVGWLTTLPFPIDNMNALLAGMGDTIEVFFERGGAELPNRSSLQPKLDAVCDDVLLVKERAEERALEIRLGVIDSKKMPLRTNHQRYRRFLEVVERVLVPLSKTVPISRVLVV